MTARPALLLCLALVAGDALADESPDVRAARYYAEGLDKPLLQVRAGAVLIQACADRLQKACTPDQRKAAAGASALTLLDQLTLFPQRPSEDPTVGISRRRDLEKKMSETSAALMREAGAFDRELFARVGAALEVCAPDEEGPDYLTALEAMKLVNYAGFQGMPAADIAKMLIDETGREEALAEKMRAAPREDCIAARKLGEYFLELMNSKLKPWNEPEPPATPPREFDFDRPKAAPEKEVPKPDDRELAHTVAGNFVTVVATELQLIVHPESEARIKALAEAQGFMY